jgi:hypothetical protein
VIFVAYKPDGEIIGTSPNLEWLEKAVDAPIIKWPRQVEPRLHRVIDGQVVPKPAAEMDAAAVADAQKRARVEIFRAVGQKRREFITDLPAQTEVYRRKEAEARAYLADPSPDMADYPRLSDEVGLTAPTADDLAALWVSMADAWDAADRAVEKARMTAKAAVASAETVADVDAALAALRGALDVVQTPEAQQSRDAPAGQHRGSHP